SRRARSAAIASTAGPAAAQTGSSPSIVLAASPERFFTAERLWCNFEAFTDQEHRMRAARRLAIVSAVLVTAVPAITQAHFKLMEPASWIIEDERGDP